MLSETHPQPAFAKALAFSLAIIASVALAASHKSQSTGAFTSQLDSSVDAPASARDFALRDCQKITVSTSGQEAVVPVA
jgi:hypothetical protein